MGSNKASVLKGTQIYIHLEEKLFQQLNNEFIVRRAVSIHFFTRVILLFALEIHSLVLQNSNKLQILLTPVNIRSKMDTRSKLKETQYFLATLIETQHDSEEGYYNLSAFLSAWRSVLDVMLYDFAEHYSIGLTREDKMMSHDFWIVAKARKNTQALDFYKWWSKKIRKLSENPLWSMRHVVVHRGYPEIIQTVYIPGSLSSGATIFLSGSEDELNELLSSIGSIPATHIIIGPPTPEIKFPDVLDMCKKGFALMQRIVDEAEKEFNVKL